MPRLSSDVSRTLSREILQTAREFRGRELKDRGVVPVVPRGEVLDYALALASHLARSSCAELKRRKRQSSEPIRAQLSQTFAQELALHDKTFVGNADVIAGLERHFRDVAADDQSAPPAQGPTHAAPQVTATLRQMLADELGTSREVVSRTLEVFQEAGMLRLGRKRIEIVDRKALDRFRRGNQA